MTARPFLKWAGGKTQLLPELIERVPSEFGTYYEPFLGGGALFFALGPQPAVITDLNSDLIDVYRVVRDTPNELVGSLKATEQEYLNASDRAAYYQEARALFNRKNGALVERAVRFIFLNRTCFNGLYRVNSDGRFNVPHGRYRNPTICDEATIFACSKALRKVAVGHVDFREFRSGPLKRPSQGDFVYFDPPYVPLNKTSSFTGYTSGGFGLQEQKDLRDMALELKAKGVHVLISNSSSEVVAEFYNRSEFTVEKVAARRNINSKGSGRGEISEYLIK